MAGSPWRRLFIVLTERSPCSQSAWRKPTDVALNLFREIAAVQDSCSICSRRARERQTGRVCADRSRDREKRRVSDLCAVSRQGPRPRSPHEQSGFHGTRRESSRRASRRTLRAHGRLKGAGLVCGREGGRTGVGRTDDFRKRHSSERCRAVADAREDHGLRRSRSHRFERQGGLWARFAVRGKWRGGARADSNRCTRSITARTFQVLR